MVEYELQRMVDSLAEHIGRSVAINDPLVHLMCASRHFGDEDEVRVHAVLQRDAGSAVTAHMLAQGVTSWTGRGIVPARDDLKMQARVCVPIRWHGHLLGLLMVIAPEGALTDTQFTAIDEAVAAMAALMYRGYLDQDRRRQEREDALRLLLSASPTEHRAGSELLDGQGRLRERKPVAVSVADVPAPGHGGSGSAGRPGTGYGPAPEAVPVSGTASGPPRTEVALRAALEGTARGRADTVAYYMDGRYGVLVQTGTAAASDKQLHDRAQEVVRRTEALLGGGRRCVVGIGSSQEDGAGAWTSLEEAYVAARAASVIAGAGPVAAWPELGSYAPLLQIPPTRLTWTLVPRPLRELASRDTHGRLVETLAAYLEHAGSSTGAASSLHIHRTSLYYRLHRIEDITGLDLSSGEVRLTLHQGVRLMALLEPEPGTGPPVPTA